MSPLPAEVEVIVDSPRFSCVKRRDDGRIDFVSPLPSPFNYGSVPGTASGDGDRIDAIVLGPRLARNTRARYPVRAIARFVDAGEDDPKWICAQRPLRARDRYQLAVFFALYVWAKRTLNWLRGRRGVTRYDGLDLCDPSPSAS